MKKTVFYSWQSDLPNGTNRSLIEAALNGAAEEIKNEAEAGIEPVIDRDTQGVAGSPNIATAIFSKIDSSDIFVADVSIIGETVNRKVPNPNVLIELGYALNALGHERIILVFNKAFGKVEDLPFDLRMHRTVTYDCPESLSDRSVVRKNLIMTFKSALSTGFLHLDQQKKTAPSIIDIIRENRPDKKIALRNYLENLFTSLEKLEPPMKRAGGTAQDLLSAIPQTSHISVELARLANTVALMNDMDSAKDIFKWFGKILTKYDPIAHGNDQTWNCDGDFYKFIGHELFVCFITPFLREEKWSELETLLKNTLPVGPTDQNRNDHRESWTELSENLYLLFDEGKKQNRLSLHADLLKVRHASGELASLVPLKQFTETDFFLHLYGPGHTGEKNDYHGDWYPRSSIYLNNKPNFISEAIDYPRAMDICRALQISNTEELKTRISRSVTQTSLHSRQNGRIDDLAIKQIGARGGGMIIRAES